MKILHRAAEPCTGRYPRPDRSSFRPKVNGIDPAYEVDLGWTEGELHDGRPYRAELRTWDHLVFITFFFSAVDLEEASGEELFALLEQENLIRFTGGRQGAAEKRKDFSENELWSVCVALRGRDGVLARPGLCFTPYRLDLPLVSEKERAGMELPGLVCSSARAKSGRPL